MVQCFGFSYQPKSANLSKANEPTTDIKQQLGPLTQGQSLHTYTVYGLHFDFINIVSRSSINCCT